MIVRGLSLWTAQLAKASVTITPRAAAEVQTTAAQVAETMRSLAPRDTGALADSIGYDTEGTAAVVGPTVPYAYFVEYGTASSPPQPYAGPATDQHEKDFLVRIEKIGGDI